MVNNTFHKLLFFILLCCVCFFFQWVKVRCTRQLSLHLWVIKTGLVAPFTTSLSILLPAFPSLVCHNEKPGYNYSSIWTSQYSNVLHVHTLSYSSALKKNKKMPISLLIFYKKYLLVQLEFIVIKRIQRSISRTLVVEVNNSLLQVTL